MLFKVLTLFVLTGVASAAVSFARLPPIPSNLEHKKGCYIKEVNDVIPLHASITAPGTCTRISCNDNYIDYATCGTILADYPCYVTNPNYNLSYPDCCPSIKCENENDIIGSLID